MQPTQKPFSFFVASLMSGALAATVPDELGERSIFDGQPPIHDAVLGELRGGFTTTSGLQISFGIERALYVNGELISTTSLNVLNLGGVTPVAPVAAGAVAGVPSASPTDQSVSAGPAAVAANEPAAANSTSPSAQISPAANAGSVALIQSGAGNSVSAGTFSAASIGTVVQNTLNNQKIQNVTVISATVNSMEILKTLNLQSALGSAINDSARK